METKDWTHQVRRAMKTARPPELARTTVMLAMLFSVAVPAAALAAQAKSSALAAAPAPPPQPAAQAPASPPPPGPATEPTQVPPPETSPAYPPPPPQYYTPPPPPYGYPYGPPHPMHRARSYYPWEEEHGVYRPLSLTLAVGPGMLIGPGERDLALSYNIFRLGIGIIRNLSLIISYEGAGTNSTNPATGERSWLSQNQWIFGLQFHFLQWFYARAGIGPGTVEETTDRFFFSNGTSLTYAGALGFEFLQTEYVALGFEASASATHYSHETWETIGWDLTVAFY